MKTTSSLFSCRATLFAPYSGMELPFATYASKMGCEIRTIHGTPQTAVHVAATLSPDQCDIILSRGITAVLIREATSIPVVSVDITPLELLQMLQSHTGSARKVALFRYATPLPGVDCIAHALNMKISQFIYTSRQEVEHAINKLIPDIDLVVGGMFTLEFAEKRGLNALLLREGEYAAYIALCEATSIVRARREEYARAARLQTILNTIDEGILVLDTDGGVSHMNPSATRLLGGSEAKVADQRLQSFTADPRSAEVIRTGKPDLGRVQDVKGTTLVVNRVPILCQGKSMGVVCSFSDAGRIRRVEGRLRSQLKNHGFTTRYTFDDIRGSSPAIQQIKELGRLYATTDAGLLICGETGTGKELFAQSVHAASPRCSAPFVAVNCAAIPEGLLESELFGYEEGAFTGARRSGKAGMFELAHTGTLFLDEVGDLSLALQGRLLRALEEKEILRVGGTQVISLNVRIICATHQPLEKLVQQRQFRADLFYRLNVLTLRLPPLRERREDIPDIAIPRLCSLLREKPDPETLRELLRPLLDDYTWPGNLRELFSTLERIALVANHCSTGTDSGHMTRNLWMDRVAPQRVSSVKNTAESTTNASGVPATEVPPAAKRLLLDLPAQGRLKERLQQAERRIIEASLSRNELDMGKTSHELGISRMTLWRKLQDDI